MRFFVCAFALLASCSAPSNPVPKPQPSACALDEFEGNRFTVCDPGDGVVRIVSDKRRFTDLKDDPASVLFAMNAGMFDEAGSPIGLMIEDGRTVHAINRKRGFGNFHLMPNGVFLVRRDGTAAVVTSETHGRVPSPEPGGSGGLIHV